MLRILLCLAIGLVCVCAEDGLIEEARFVVPRAQRTPELSKGLLKRGFPSLTRDGELFIPETAENELQGHFPNITFERLHDYRDRLRPISPSYHTDNELFTTLSIMEQKHDNLVRAFSFGRSVLQRRLMAAEVTENVHQSAGNKPIVALLANIHGDEAVGREILIHLVEHLAASYSSGTRIQKLLKTTRFIIVPSINPDGFDHHRRTNARAIDLNRNFPDRFYRNSHHNHIQPEVEAVMNLHKSYHIVLSGIFHGGALVSNYPWDGNRAHRSGRYTPCPDDLLFRSLASTYAKAHKKMSTSSSFSGGITNGAAWYVLYGGSQDYVYEKTNAFELTLEISKEKYPHGAFLSDYWEDNLPAILAYAERVHQCGAFGQVTRRDGTAVANAIIRVKGVSDTKELKMVKTNEAGYYWRPLSAGQAWQVYLDGSEKNHIHVHCKQETEPSTRANFVQ
jgi:carboxypeptidase D